MTQNLILAENIIFKNNKLSCINIYDRLTTVAMPAEFTFDLVIMCGPNWSAGEHKLSVIAKANNGKEISIGELTVNIPNEDYVYNAYAQDLKIRMDYSVENLTFVVYDNDNEIISRKYPVVSFLVPKKSETSEQTEEHHEQQSEPANV